MTGMNPFDWYGGAFLALYAFLLVGAFLGGFALASWLRPEGRAVPVTDDDELALLAGGPARLAESVVARLLARDEAEIDEQRLVLGSSLTGRSPVERELAGLSSPAKWKEVREWVAASAHRIEELLIGCGLLMERSQSRQLGFYAAIPLVLLIAFGLTKLEIGLGRDRPVGFLAAFLIITAIVALFRVFATDRRTKGGVAAVRDARDRSERMRRAPTREETGTAVALWGTTVLVGSPFVDLHKMRRTGDGGGGDGGRDGGSGCGGGGCGGCGG